MCYLLRHILTCFFIRLYFNRISSKLPILCLNCDLMIKGQIKDHAISDYALLALVTSNT